ncbi:MAG TPA: class I SAM-dependent methyltransferase [Bacteroidia bacterium]|nr:class I SAM-dependent methyltransferase [Bacteroidia bacterium]
MAGSFYSFLKKGVKKRLKKYYRALRGDHFDNAGAVTEFDYAVLKAGIDEVKPSTYIEIGTGKGISATQVFNYLQEKFPQCHFYTLEIFQQHYEAIREKYKNSPCFHALLGLSVTRGETTNPAHDELANYTGPVNTLRTLLENDFAGKKIDIAFIDSRKGSALAEFKLIEKHLSPRGIIFCHDILNRGKGVEVLLHLQQHKNRYDFDVLDTGPAGMIRIRLKSSAA